MWRVGNCCPGFYEDWILRERDRLNLLRADTFRRLAAAQEEAGQIEAAIGALQQLFALDAAQEEATANLMRLYIQMGQAPSALQQFRRWEQIARDEHGMSPSRQLRELAAQAEAVSHHPVALPAVREKAANREFAIGKQSARAETAQSPASPALLSSQHVADPSASEGADNELPFPFQPRLPVTLTRSSGAKTNWNSYAPGSRFQTVGRNRNGNPAVSIGDNYGCRRGRQNPACHRRCPIPCAGVCGARSLLSRLPTWPRRRLLPRQP